MPDLLFFTCCNERYEPFAPLYACSVLHHVAEAGIEIGVENGAAFALRHHEALRVLRRHFPGRLLVRDVSFAAVIPNSVRFVTVPHTRARYTYIGDIDILVLEQNVLATHLELMAKTGLPYSNTIRAGQPDRLTGLHFTPSETYYPLPDLSDLDLSREKDEHLLCKIIKRRGHPIPAIVGQRPQHGIHMSPTRQAFVPRSQLDANGNRIPDWSLPQWREQYEAFARSRPFRELWPHLQGIAAESISQIEAHYASGA